MIRSAVLASLLAALAAPAAAQSSADDARFRQAQDRFDREYQTFRQELDRYQAARGGYRNDGYRPNGYRTAPDRP